VTAQTVLSAAIIVTLLTSAAIVVRWGGRRVEGPLPLSLLGFMTLLFTSGLDVGLIMLPLTEFPVYAREPEYAFANPLAIAFGFWGFLVWGFYFLTTFYFLTVEPHLRLFEIPAVKVVNNIIIVGTCAFTAHLLLRNLPFYVPSIDDGSRYGIVGATVLLSVLTSTHIRFIRVLSVSSMWMFGALVVAMWLASGMGARGLAYSAAEIGPYFRRLPHFVLGTMGDMVRGYFKSSGVPLPFMPAARLGALARWDDGTRSVGAEYRHAFAQTRVPPAVTDADPAGMPTSAYNLVNLNFGYNLSLAGRVHSIMLRADNLLDERYVDATSRIKTFAFNPGRNLALVYRVEF